MEHLLAKEGVAGSIPVSRLKKERYQIGIVLFFEPWIRSINYKDEDTMKRVEEARAITDETERLAEYDALEKKIVQDDAAWVPLFGRTHLFVISDRVAKFVPHWAGYSDFNISGVTMAE